MGILSMLCFYIVTLSASILPAVDCSPVSPRISMNWGNDQKLQAGEALHYRTRRLLQTKDNTTNDTTNSTQAPSTTLMENVTENSTDEVATNAGTDLNTTTIETNETTSMVATTEQSTTVGTDDLNGDTTEPKSSRRLLPQTTTPQIRVITAKQLAKILSGTVVAMLVIIVAFVVTIVLLVVLVCKVNRRRKLERDLVLRTKQDIFEGVPNVFTREEISTSHKYNMDCGSLEGPTTEEETGGGCGGEDSTKDEEREP